MTKPLEETEPDSDDNEEEVDDEHDAKEYESTTTGKGWMAKLALFGDSGWLLLASSLVLGIALATNWYIHSQEPVDPYKLLGPIPLVDPPHMFELPASVATNPTTVTTDRSQPLVSKQMLAAYEKDGVVAIRGLFTPSQIDRLDVASRELIEQHLNGTTKEQRRLKPTTFFTIKDNLALFEPFTENIPSAFLDVALFSSIPIIAAELMRMKEGRDENLRLLRDVFLAKDDDETVCGWHVDDIGFWPATAASPGVNAWIAIDDMPIVMGGGLALAVGSHRARWKQEAYTVIGATPTFPPQGYKSVDDFLASRTASGTCNIKSSAPHLHRRMEETKRVYEMQRGDVIFASRWLFHRTVPLDKNETANYQAEHGVDDLIYRRYSLRYAPGSAILPPSFALEPSVLWNPENGGRTADAVSQLDGPWYPQCWPSVSSQEMEQLRELARNKLPIAEERRQARMKELFSLFKALAKQKEQNRSNNE